MSNVKIIMLDVSYNKSLDKKDYKDFKNNMKIAKLIKSILELNGIEVILKEPLNPKCDCNNFIVNENAFKKIDGLISIQNNLQLQKYKNENWIFYWHTSQESGKLAALIDRALDGCLGDDGRDITASMPDSWNDFKVLRESKEPAVLIEYSYFSNNEGFLNDRYLISKCALSTAEGIMQFLGMKKYVLKVKKNKIIVLLEGTIKLLNKLLKKLQKREEN